MSCEMIHLHSHSDQGSLLDGMARIEETIDTALKFGQPGIAITDHGRCVTPFRATQYVRKKKLGFKIIWGLEAYWCEDRSIKPESDKEIRASMVDYGGSEEEKGEEIAAIKKGQKNYHLTLLVKNETGYHNLMRLVHASNQEDAFQPNKWGRQGTPRVDWELLYRYREGLIVLSGCSNGPVARAILADQEDKTLEYIFMFQKIFGDDFYAEMMPISYPDQRKINQEVARIARARGIPLVATNDIHYVRAEDADTHEVLLCIQTYSRMSEPTRQHGGKRFALGDGSYYLRSRQEMMTAAQEHEYLPVALWDAALDQSMKILATIDFELPRQVTSFPAFKVP